MGFWRWWGRRREGEKGYGFTNSGLPGLGFKVSGVQFRSMKGLERVVGLRGCVEIGTNEMERGQVARAYMG